MSLIKSRTTTANKPKVGSSSKFQYRARSPEQVRERAQRQIGGRDGYFNSDAQFYTPREGDNTVRILPPPPDSDWGHYGINIVGHYDIGADSSAYLCLDKMRGEPCPICEERARATAAGEEDLADALRPGYRVGIYVIDRAQESKGPLLWNMAGGLDKDITKLCIHPKTGEVLPVDDPDDGYDLIFSREGQGLKTKYKGVQFDRASSPLSDDPDAAEKWLQYVVDHSLENQLQFFDYEYTKKAFAGQPPPADEDETKSIPESKPKAADKPVERPKLATRGKAAAKPTPPPEPAKEEQVELPTWDDLQAMDEDTLAALGEEAGLEFPADGFDSLESLRTWTAEQLQIEEPKPAPAVAKGSWKDRLKSMQKK